MTHPPTPHPQSKSLAGLQGGGSGARWQQQAGIAKPSVLAPGSRPSLSGLSWGLAGCGNLRQGSGEGWGPRAPHPPQPIPQSQGSAHRIPGSHPLSPLAILQGGATSEGAGSVFGHPARPPGTTCSGPTNSPFPAGKGKFTKHGGQAGRFLALPPGCQKLLVKGWHFC